MYYFPIRMKVTFKLGLEGYKYFKYEELHCGAGKGRTFTLVRTGMALSEKETLGQLIQVVWCRACKAGL